jgi:hypothetical protein
MALSCRNERGDWPWAGEEDFLGSRSPGSILLSGPDLGDLKKPSLVHSPVKSQGGFFHVDRDSQNDRSNQQRFSSDC